MKNLMIFIAALLLSTVAVSQTTQVNSLPIINNVEHVVLSGVDLNDGTSNWNPGPDRPNFDDVCPDGYDSQPGPVPGNPFRNGNYQPRPNYNPALNVPFGRLFSPRPRFLAPRNGPNPAAHFETIRKRSHLDAYKLFRGL